jgi:hypothetical protein
MSIVARNASGSSFSISIQAFPGDEFMSEPMKCTKCGSDRLEPGQIATHFRPDNIKFLAATPGIAIVAYMCQDCGVLLLGGDPDALRELLKKE